MGLDEIKKYIDNPNEEDFKEIAEVKIKEIDQEIKLLTAKKDRSITVKNDGEKLTVIEDGYLHINKKYLLTETAECRHAVLAAFKKEFPRSNRAYLNAIRN